MEDDGYATDGGNGRVGGVSLRNHTRSLSNVKRKRRHSSLQFENRGSMSLSPRGADVGDLSVATKRNSGKIQIFKVFGVHLPLLLRKERALMGLDEKPRMSVMREDSEHHHSIPHIVKETVEYLKSSDGYKTPGIFRQCGKHSELLKAQDQIDKGVMITKEQLEALDPHTVGDILKTFLRLLPHPLIPVEEFYAHFLVSTKIEEKQQYMAFLGALIMILPVDRRALLDYLCEFFHQIIDFSTENMMGASNLAIIFSPAFFGQSFTMDSSRIVLEAKATSKITQTLIENYPKIFREKHCPMEILIVNESVKYGNISLLKGEEVLWFQLKESDEKGFMWVGGRLHYVEKELKSKCKIKELSTYEDFLISPKKHEEDAAREDALRILGGSKSNLISASTYVSAGINAVQERDRVIAEVTAAAEEAKRQKRGHIRRKSSEIFNLVVRKDSSEEPEEEKKEKKARKQKQKKINSTVTNWYSSPATKSTNSFFLMRSKSTKSLDPSRKLKMSLPGGKKKKTKAQERIEKRRLNSSTPEVFSTPVIPSLSAPNVKDRRASVHFSESDQIATARRSTEIINKK